MALKLDGVQYSLYKPVGPQAFQRRLLQYKVEAQLNHSQLTHPRLRDLLVELNPAAAEHFPGSRATVRAWMREAYQKQKAIVIEMLRTALSEITIIFDTSTSRNDLQFLAITALVVDQSGQLQHLPLALRHTKGQKTAMKQA